MDVHDFFYLAHYDNHFIDNFLNMLMNKKILKRHYTKGNIHCFDLQIAIDEDFILENFGTSDINDIKLRNLSDVCIANVVSIQPISDIINDVRVKSDFYPHIESVKMFLKHDDLEKEIAINYYITIHLVPDSN